jgi:hypothetical protein
MSRGAACRRAGRGFVIRLLENVTVALPDSRINGVTAPRPGP